MSPAPPWIVEAVAYTGFSAADEEALRRFHAVAHPHYASVVEHFYAVIERHRDARRVITGGADQITRLKHTLTAWLVSGLDGGHGDAWYQARARIGQRHVAIGLPARYMFTAINVIRSDLAHLVGELIAPDERAVTVAAIDRWLDLELAIMLHSYQEASEQRLLQRERDAQRENLLAMRRLSAGLAHEIRNPLNSAHLQLELLVRRLRRAGADAAMLDVTTLIDGEIARLSRLLQEFLDFARPVQLAPIEVDLVVVAHQVLELNAIAARRRGIVLELEGDPSVAVVGDGRKLHRIVHNLVVNAIEAATSRVVVELRARPGLSAAVTICVRDDGAGVPDELRPRIFEPFFSTKDAGTGMGLSVTASLVTLHGGTVDVANHGGAEFTVTLPLATSPA